MKLAIASGKGGTGKTTLSVALAQAAGQLVQYLDCDVEEPNGDLFLHPDVDDINPVSVLQPEVDLSLCDGCGDCADLCQFNAIVSQGRHAMVFPELCHSCGGCVRVCPNGAITEVERPIGSISKGRCGQIDYIQGRLDIGNAMSPPLIRAVKQAAREDRLTIIDCPPGTSCPMIVAVRDADFVLLVTEPTPFGLHDLQLAVETVRQLGRSFAVAINRADAGDDRVERYCAEEGIEILLRIPENRAAAEACSRGETIISVLPGIKEELRRLLRQIESKVEGGQE